MIESLQERILFTTVTNISPLRSTHTAPVSTNIVANFDQDIVGGLATPQTFAVHSMQRGRLVSGAAIVSTTGSAVTLNPTADFFPGELVQATVTSSVQSSAVDTLSPVVWQFRTGVSSGSGVFSAGQGPGNHDSNGVALGDLDGDGDLDAFAAITSTYGDAASGANGVWLNDGGAFSDSGQRLGNHNSWAVALGDLDEDGDLDAFVVNGDDGSRIWLNNGGVFTNSGQTLGRGIDSREVSIGDVDADGDLDAFTADHLWINDGGLFSPGDLGITGFSVRQATLGDLDGDGDLDAFATQSGSNGHRVWLNEQGPYGGGWVDSGQSLGNLSSWRASLGDLDGDGDLDAFVVNWSLQGNRVWLNDGGGLFSDSGQVLGNHFSYAVALGDLDADGDLDAFVDTRGTGDRVWLNDGGGQFSDSGQGLGYQDSSRLLSSVALGDLDGDGDLDALSTTGAFGGDGGGTNEVWLNQQDGGNRQPTVTLSVDNATISEAGGVASFTVTLSEATTVPVTVDLGISGTAAANDYAASAAQIVVAAGATTGSVTVTAVDDTLDEVDETVIVDIASVTNGTESGVQQQTITIIDDDEPPGFMVSFLTPTGSGFVAEFNADLDPGPLNLYDTQFAGLGAADVVMEGATSGPIAGSLIVNASLRMVTFIKTGDPLAPDVYTVTLRSADDGFKDAIGVLLDGDGNGTAGGDFSDTFTIAVPAANSVTVSFSDFVRGPGQGISLPADTTAGIPLSISEGEGVRTAEIQIDYDPAILTITAASVGPTMPGGATVVLDTSTAGTAIVTFTSPTDLPAGGNVLVNLQAIVPDTDPSGIYGKQQVLDVHSVTISDGNDNELPVIAADALHLASYFGDVSGNGRINASDAAQVARFAALIDTGFTGSLLTDPIVVGDISGNRRINAADASRVARFAALIEVPEIPPIPGGIRITGARLDVGPGLPGILTLPLDHSPRPPADQDTTDISGYGAPLASAAPIPHPAVEFVMSRWDIGRSKTRMRS